MRVSSGGKEYFPNIRGTKKSRPQLSSSSYSLSKNISSTIEKAVPQTVNDDQPSDFFKKGNRMSESHQKTRSMSAGPSWNKVKHSKTSSGKRQNKSQVPQMCSQLKSSLEGASLSLEGELKEVISLEGKPEKGPFNRQCQETSGSKLFLDFQSMKIMKEDTDQDSASDLSDSERVPIVPSPLTPPELNLRAEEIDPVSFDLPASQAQLRPVYQYPDFLPPPFNSWDLSNMCGPLNNENRPGPGTSRVGGPLGKYIDRLMQLEWLQAQTVQGERAKGIKARPSTALGTSTALKSPGRSKFLTSTLSKSHQDILSKPGPSRKKDFHREDLHPSYYTFETSLKSVETLSSSKLCAQKSPFEIRTEDKRKKSSKNTKLQHWDVSSSDSKIESNGNIRIPRQSTMILNPTDSCKTSRTQAHTNMKKTGNANNYGHATVSSEKKLKTNGVKQSTYKFK